MENKFKIVQEGLTTISDNTGLVAVIRRNPITKVHQVSMCRDAITEDIVKLIQPDLLFEMEKGHV